MGSSEQEYRELQITQLREALTQSAGTKGTRVLAYAGAGHSFDWRKAAIIAQDHCFNPIIGRLDPLILVIQARAALLEDPPKASAAWGRSGMAVDDDGPSSILEDSCIPTRAQALMVRGLAHYAMDHPQRAIRDIRAGHALCQDIPQIPYKNAWVQDIVIAAAIAAGQILRDAPTVEAATASPKKRNLWGKIWDSVAGPAPAAEDGPWAARFLNQVKDLNLAQARAQQISALTGALPEFQCPEGTSIH